MQHYVIAYEVASGINIHGVVKSVSGENVRRWAKHEGIDVEYAHLSPMSYAEIPYSQSPVSYSAAKAMAIEIPCMPL